MGRTFPQIFRYPFPRIFQKEIIVKFIRPWRIGTRLFKNVFPFKNTNSSGCWKIWIREFELLRCTRRERERDIYYSIDFYWKKNFHALHESLSYQNWEFLCKHGTEDINAQLYFIIYIVVNNVYFYEEMEEILNNYGLKRHARDAMKIDTLEEKLICNENAATYFFYFDERRGKLQESSRTFVSNALIRKEKKNQWTCQLFSGLTIKRNIPRDVSSLAFSTKSDTGFSLSRIRLDFIVPN